MKNFLSAFSFCSIALFSGTATAQQPKHRCATDDIINAHMAAHPEKQAAFEALKAEQKDKLDKALAKGTTDLAFAKTTAGYTIPVIFHVVLTAAQLNAIGGASGAHVRASSQIKALNRDFNANNFDKSTIPSVFQPLMGNMNINFDIARTDPNGKGISGVEIKTVTATGFEVLTGDEKSPSTSGLAPWDNTKYLNVWVCNITNGSGGGTILGYALSPSYAGLLNVPHEAGVTLNFGAFGQRNTAGLGTFISGIDSGRTMVHELGHFFTLNHIWGNTAPGDNPTCADDDGVGDTPLQSDGNYGCPSYPQPNCPPGTTGGQMFMNYMDYVDDRCMKLFTKQQVTRMLTELAQGGDSHGLTQNTHLTKYPAGVADVDGNFDFTLLPNPSTGMFNIGFNNTPATLKGIEIVNMVGQTVQQITTNNNNSYQADLSNMPKGIYMVKCRFDETTVTRKIVLQ